VSRWQCRNIAAVHAETEENISFELLCSLYREQSENKMRLLITLAVFLCRWWMVCGRCPFPGITAHANFWNSSDHRQSSFEEGYVIEYRCRTYWNAWNPPLKLTCQSDGTWDHPLPACGNLLILKFLRFQLH
jgi:Sushi repeat (SCR repeat)